MGFLLDFEDDYNKLTNKLLASFVWISRNFRDFKYVVKADDDSFVRIDRYRVSPACAPYRSRAACHVVHDVHDTTLVRHCKSLADKNLCIALVLWFTLNVLLYEVLTQRFWYRIVSELDDIDPPAAERLYWGYFDGRAEVNDCKTALQNKRNT